MTDTIIHLDTNTKGPVREFISRTGRALLDPVRFYREDFPRLDAAEALSFGLVGAWIASLLSFFWSTINSYLIVRIFERWVQRMLASDDSFALLGTKPDSFLWAAGALLLTPFLLLGRAFLSAVMLYLFSRLLVGEDQRGAEPVSFPAALKIQGVALTGQWFTVVPFFGGFIALIVGFVLTVTGVRERFGTSTRRAVAVVFAPYALLFIGLLAILALMGLAIFQLPLDEILAGER